MRKYQVLWYVWSTGLQTWEPIDVSFKEIATFVYLYSKRWDGRELAICRDVHGRFVGGLHT